MSWFKVDDTSAFNAKVMAAGNDGWGAFCRVGAWCAQQLTDGKFSRAIALTIAPMKVWDRLATVGLVDRLDNGEMQMHDYLQRNPSKAQVLAERDATRARVNAFRNGKRNAVTNDSRHADVPVGSGREEVLETENQRDTDSFYGPPLSAVVEVASTAEEVAVASHVHSKAIFRGARWARHVGKETAGWMMGKLWLNDEEKLGWVLSAIDDAAGKCPPDANEQTKQAMVWGFIKRASKPRQTREEVGKRAHEVERREEAWEREKHTAVAPADVIARLEAFGKVGTGGRR